MFGSWLGGWLRTDMPPRTLTHYLSGLFVSEGHWFMPHCGTTPGRYDDRHPYTYWFAGRDYRRGSPPPQFAGSTLYLRSHFYTMRFCLMTATFYGVILPRYTAALASC